MGNPQGSEQDYEPLGSEGLLVGVQQSKECAYDPGIASRPQKEDSLTLELSVEAQDVLSGQKLHIESTLQRRGGQ